MLVYFREVLTLLEKNVDVRNYFKEQLHAYVYCRQKL
jgi:hypothetical protein